MEYVTLARQAEDRWRHGASGRASSANAPPTSLRAGEPVFEEVVTRTVAMPLGVFAREGQCLEIRVPWTGTTLWFVPTDRDATALEREGVHRGRVWTASELMALMTLPDRTPALVRNLALAKIAVDDDIVEVRAR